MMARAVYLTDAASTDLHDIFSYILRHDSPAHAERLLAQFESVFHSLNTNPERGHWPDELAELGIREYRQLYLHSYRILYRVNADAVHIVLICDGRRDMSSLLQRRLLS